jgi:hypothetical protein
LSLDVDELQQMAIEGIDSTWLDDSDRRALTAEFRATADSS